MSVYQLRIPLEDGMRVKVIANPKLTQWGKFSLTIRDVQPVGEGSLKKAFQLLHAKLDKEGLFGAERKRSLPAMPSRIGVISSTAAAGYADFIKILNERWGGVEIIVAHTQVQGLGAANQIIGAISYFNELAEPPDVLVVVRGGGSADDLSVFNDELLVRALSASRVPTLTGIGHEIDTSLVDLVADYQASTPSNAAQIVVPDKNVILESTDRHIESSVQSINKQLRNTRHTIQVSEQKAVDNISRAFDIVSKRHEERLRYVQQLNPIRVLRHGYSLIRSDKGKIISGAEVGDVVTIETYKKIIIAGVTHVTNK